jgi:subtilisin family serine protease
MGSGGARAHTASDRILRPTLLLSVALAALVVAAPAGNQTSAWAMQLGGSGAARFNAGSHVFAPVGHIGGPVIGTGHAIGVVGHVEPGPAVGNGRPIGVVGHVDPGNGSTGNVCNPDRGSRRRCVVNNTGPGGNGGNPRLHPPHVIVTTPGPVVPANPTIVMTRPTSPGIGSPPPGGSGAPVVARRTGGVPPPNERRYARDEVVSELSASTTDQQADALGRRQRLTRLQSVTFGLGGTTLVRWRINDRRSVPAVVRALETDATVLSAQPNYLFALQDETLPPAAREGDPAQYILDKMHLPQAHELVKGSKVLVAVIDSGVDVTHPDLAGDIAGTFDALGTGLKPHSHGTAIAGAIAAHGRLMGAAPAAQILAVRAFSGEGGDDGTTFAIMSGLNWAVSHGARVINMSFAGPQDPGIARSLAAAHDRGVTLVAAAGNKGAKSPPLYPAADPHVIAVTSTDASDQLPAFANRGGYVAVAAPGVDLMLLAPNGTLQVLSGTSFSAAYVTGTAALMLERKPDLAPDSLRLTLTGTAHRLKADESGSGLVDAYQAVLSLAPSSVDAANAVPAAAVRR